MHNSPKFSYQERRKNRISTVMRLATPRHQGNKVLIFDRMLSAHLVRWRETNPEHRQLLLTLIDEVYSDSVNQVANGIHMEFRDFPHFGGTTDVPLYYPASWSYLQVLIG